MCLKHYAASILLCMLTSTSYAQSSRDFAVMGATTWASFKCASLASYMNDRAAEERHFTLGYEYRKKFLEALQNKQIEQKDISGEVPIGFILLIAGPSSDFILGRVFEVVQQDVLRKVRTSP